MGTLSLVCIWLVLLGTCSSSPRNLALRGRATQSSLANYPVSALGHAYNAVDGNTNPDFHDGSCSQTSCHNDPWWRLDLGDIYVVTDVVVHTRGGRASHWLTGAKLRIGNSLLDDGVLNPLAGDISYIPAGGSLTLSGNPGFEGRYVVVVLPGIWRVLSLCEVEVYGYLVPSELSIAIRGKATQSSLYTNCFANNAIDGNRDAAYDHGSCSHTSNNFKPWWRLDLEVPYKIFRVAVTNRLDCCSERMNGTEIRIGNSLANQGNDNPRCVLISSIAAGATETYQCNGMDGRYVNLVVPGRAEYLTLCEVEVFGSPLAEWD